MKESEETYCVTTREELDVIQIMDKEGNIIAEIAVLEIRKAKVKLGFRADKAIKYALLRAIPDGIH